MRTFRMYIDRIVSMIVFQILRAYAFSAMIVLMLGGIILGWQILTEGSRGILLYAYEMFMAHQMLGLYAISFPIFMIANRFTSINRTRVSADSVIIVDGDTIRLRRKQTSLGEQTPIAIRIAGYDAPELNQAFGKQAAQYLRSRIQEAGGISIRSYSSDKYGRAVADVWLGMNGRQGNVAAAMIKAGYGHKDSRSSFSCYLATLPARIAGRGIWTGDLIDRLMGAGVIRPSVYRQAYSGNAGRHYQSSRPSALERKISRESKRYVKNFAKKTFM